MLMYTLKRLLSLLIVVTIAISMFACDQKGSKETTPETKSETDTETESIGNAVSDSETEPTSDTNDSTETDTNTPECEHPYAASPEYHCNALTPL